MTTTRSSCFSPAGFTIPPLACLRSLTSTQDDENTTCQEHRGHDCREIKVEPIRQSSSWTFAQRTELNGKMRSASGPLGIALRCPPFVGTIQIAALLDMAGVCIKDDIGHTQKALGNDSSHFKSVEVLGPHFRQNSF